MKRTLFIKHLTNNGCVLLREGGCHSLYKNTLNGRISSVPRHPEIQEITMREICKQLDISPSKIN